VSAAGTPPPGDQARASVLVAVPREEAFRIFTEEIDQWWRSGPQYRALARPTAILHLEPHAGGRIFETQSGEGDARVIETGRITDWDPPARFTFRWRASNFAPAEWTNVEVTFASSPSGTLVTVTHRGWSRIRPDHPVRHGQPVAAFIRSNGLWWGGLLTSLREHAGGTRL